jgi:hypothetical protein
MLRNVIVALILGVLAVAPSVACVVGTAAEAAAFKVGDKVAIEWKGTWWEGSVLEANNGQFKVHYTGWNASWDETVSSARLRASNGTARRGSEIAE